MQAVGDLWAWLLSLSFLSALLSLCASSWMCARLWSLQGEDSQRLFPRQLLCLAFADVLFSITCLSVSLVALLIFVGVDVGDLSRFFLLPYKVFSAMSLLNETHIAVSFAVQSFRLTELTVGTPRLTRSLPWMFVMGLNVGLLDGLSQQLDVKHPGRLVFLPSFLIMSGCFLIGMVSYIVAICRTSIYKLPARVKTMYPQAGLHLLSFSITRVPSMLVQWNVPWWTGHLNFILLAAICEWAAGAVHVMIFPKMKELDPPRCRHKSNCQLSRWPLICSVGCLARGAMKVDFGSIDVYSDNSQLPCMSEESRSRGHSGTAYDSGRDEP